MASFTLSAGDIGAYAKTLVASTVDTITFAGYVGRVEIVNEGTGGIYCTITGVAPTVAGATTIYVPANAVREIPVPLVYPAVGGGAAAVTVVKLISSGTPTYSVAQVV